MHRFVLYIRNWLQILHWFCGARFLSDVEKDLEILALRSQLSIVQQHIINHKAPKPRFTRAFRQLWILLSRLLSKWKDTLVLVKPETVLSWHKTAFKLYWRRKSGGGRPKTSRAAIAISFKHN